MVLVFRFLDIACYNLVLFRCLLEIYTAAMTPDMTIVMKGGSHRRLSDGRVIFDSELDMLNILTQFVDVDHAQAWFQSDRETILKKIRESSLGIEGAAYTSVHVRV